MRQHQIIYHPFFSFLFFCLFSFKTIFGLENSSQQQNSPISSLASLTYYLQAHEKNVNENDRIAFTDDQVSSLWIKVYGFINNQPFLESRKINHELDTAFEEFHAAKESLLAHDHERAKYYFLQSSERIYSLWKTCIEGENNEIEPEESFKNLSKLNQLNCTFKQPNTRKKIISSTIQKQMNPYLIPLDHVMKPVLDRLFSNRITQERKTLTDAGFKIIDRRSRSFICVVSHPDLPEYLLKLYLDRDKREKYGKPSWQWLVKRCQGAEKIHAIIDKFSIKHFVCAKKWIYILPENPPPPSSSKYTRHLAVLLVNDMQLIPAADNYEAWKSNITEEHLDELYILVTRGKGSSYRPDNLPFTKKGKIAFIDTEYPDKGPDFNSIREHLNDKMRKYWDKLVTNGGY